MKGLLYKEFLLYRGYALVMLGVYVMISFLCISMPIIGFEADALMVLLTLCYWVIFAFVGFLTSELFRKDERQSWNSFVTSLPGTVKSAVQCKYYTMLMIHLVTLFGLFVLDCIVVGVANDLACSALIAVVMIFCWRMFMNAIELPFILRFGYVSGMWVKGIVLVIMLAGAIVYGLFGDISFFVEGNVLQKIKEFFMNGNAIWILALFPYITVGAYYLSYRISLKLYQKGAENYEQ